MIILMYFCSLQSPDAADSCFGQSLIEEPSVTE